MILNVVDNQDSNNIITQLIIIAILTLINAFLAASELAILSANPNKLNMKVEEGNKKAKLVLKLQSDQTKLLSTIQVGITLAGFFSSATAAVSLSEGMASLLASINFPFAKEIALVIVTLILSYFTLVLGELFPKRIALKSPEKIAMALAKPVSIIKAIFRPVVFILSASCTLLAKLFRLNKDNNEKVTESEVMALVNEAVDDGTIKEEEQELIENIIEFGDLRVKDIMKPRVDVFMIDIDSTPAEIKRLLKKEKYTRVPVYENSNDNIIGVINIKDIFFELKANFTIEEFRGILRKPYFVVESMTAQALFNSLNEIHDHSAIVIDEVGSVSGYITLEDLIEEITGNIYDEHDEEFKLIEKVSEDTFIVDASISIQDLDRELDIALPKNSDYNSLAGFIQNQLQQLAKVNDECHYADENVTFKVLMVSNNRVISVQITKNKDEEALNQ